MTIKVRQDSAQVFVRNGVSSSTKLACSNSSFNDRLQVQDIINGTLIIPVDTVNY